MDHSNQDEKQDEKAPPAREEVKEIEPSEDKVEVEPVVIGKEETEPETETQTLDNHAPVIGFRTAAQADAFKIPFSPKYPVDRPASPAGGPASGFARLKPQGQSSKSSLNKKRLLLVIAAVILLILAVVSIFKIKNRKTSEPSSQGPGPAATSTPKPTSTPTPTPAEMKLAEYKVQILNGAGVPGAAKKVQAALAAEGLKNFTTANADNFDYSSTQVSFKSNLPKGQIFEVLENALKNNYKISLSDKVLEENSEFDIQIIIGPQKAAE